MFEGSGHVSHFFVGAESDRGGVRLAISDVNRDGVGELCIEVNGAVRAVDAFSATEFASNYSVDELRNAFEYTAYAPVAIPDLGP